jgi:preprotein translocase subunit YajC
VTTGRITRVWAIVHSPDFTITPDNPITDLPTFDLTWNEQNRRYEGTYNGFTVMGTYTVTVYATNEEMIISLPKTTKVEQLLHTLYTLTIVKSGTGSGMVTSSPAGINCGDDCSETYSKVQKVKLTAKADASSTFTGWSGGGCSGTKTCTVTVDTAVTVIADFALKTPDISIAQTSLDFGSIKVGKKKTKTLKITSNGTGDLVITLSGLEGTDFSIQGSSSVTIKAKKSYSLKVLCTPTSGGLKTATLEIDSNDPDTPTLEISLTAALPATTPDISVAQTPIEFGSIKVGKKVTKTLKITNNGTGDLVITLSGLEETDFSIQGSSSVTIKAKKTYSLKILFTPKSAGLETATLEVNSNDLDSPSIDISLSGTGQ